ncbi:MAG: methyltransferase FkbM family [Mucilaginibacter sp.]|nr:methyltransferase FkbM family [Mucilaginibacter sp.]
MTHIINLYTIYKCLTDAAFRKIYKEKKRLQRSKRYKKGTTSLLGNTLTYVDANTCYYGYLEIFEKQPYKFIADNNNPYIIDCGANIGLSILYFKSIYPRATIIAFEPDPDIYKVLQTNIESFKLTNITIHQAAVWTYNGSLDFQIEGGMSGRIPKITDKTNIRKVDAIRLKDLLVQPIDFLKIDIEGAEYEVIKDCAGLLYLVKHLFIEYHSHITETQKLDELLNILTAQGFRYHIHEAYTVTSPFVNQGDMLDMDLQLNIYAKKV